MWALYFAKYGSLPVYFPLPPAHINMGTCFPICISQQPHTFYNLHERPRKPTYHMKKYLQILMEPVSVETVVGFGYDLKIKFEPFYVEVNLEQV